MELQKQSPDDDDVVITGIGLVAGTVTDPEELFWQLADGASFIRQHQEHRDAELPASVSGHVDEETVRKLARALPEQAARVGAAGVLGWHAAVQAWKRSGLPNLAGSDRVGVFAACNKLAFAPDTLADLSRLYDRQAGTFDLDAYLDHLEAVSDLPDDLLQFLPDTMTASLAEYFGLGGPLVTHAEACAAGGVAIGSGYRHIRSGELDVALVGGAERLTTYSIVTAFAALGALAPTGDKPSAEISRPFDKGRNGFVIADGAAFLVLERRSHAEARGAQALARVAGYMGTAEAVRITSSERDGATYAECMRAAIADAGLSPSDIHHVNAHGTGTQANDECEAAALHLVFGAGAASIPLTSNKSSLGHGFAASGAIEAVLSAMSLREQIIPPTLNFSEPDDVTKGLDVVTKARHHEFDTVLSNSFGFGGMNCTLILAKEA